ncbi:2-hydroxyacid dehydrogenase [Thermoflavimicrobium dichotomicum]|uniref:Glyoxylate reductase n=1 Tax=Thermoflavimicrobium dichotomicum TaxID=46223 RepID=A0A1I3MTG7_9BACL|nr:D-glycerate dehydrogenase [Thermoflavimicrobium dichotomicum]SFJ00404.1 glyoxylate reductase [Thermoflavimicrobium dichotomicum]
MKKQIVLTRRLQEECMYELGQHFELEVVGGDETPKREDLLRSLQGKEALICTVAEKIDPELMEACPDLRIISNYGVGFDNIDVSAANRRGILVTNTPDVLTDATADLTWALMLSVARRAVEGDRLIRNGQWHGWAPHFMLGWDVSGKTLGIVGMGRIGQAVARRAIGFNMRILYYSRTRLKEEQEKELRAQYCDLDELLAQADFVSLHTPYSPETHHLIGHEQLSKMKRTAFLINTARGAVVDEQALIHALQSGKIAGAGLDVFEQEPYVPDELRQMEQVVLIPHLGSATRETRLAMGRKVIENLTAYFRGEKPPYLVNPEIWC